MSGGSPRLSAGRSIPLVALLLGVSLAGGIGTSRAAPGPPDEPPVEGVVFAPDYGTLYAPVLALEAALALPLLRTGEETGLLLGKAPLARRDERFLPDGTPLVRLRLFAELPELGVTVEWRPDEETDCLRHGEKVVRVRPGRRTVADSVTFDREPDVWYVPLPDVSRALALPEAPAGESPGKSAEGPAGRHRFLPDGTRLVSLRELDATIFLAGSSGKDGVRLERGGRELWVRHGAKRVALNLREQRMRAWEGDRVVLDTRVSSGRKGMETPKGFFRAGPLKRRMLISHKYGDAEMPWSVQVYRGVFIQGFPSVPPRAASHGCIRVPLTGMNPARWFYEWVAVDTPIEIADDWPATWKELEPAPRSSTSPG